jgi:FKBP-type peptidyl-prolyl cis-trans isomerase 2
MEKGDIVQLEYEEWIAGTNKLSDTTNEELARKENAFEEEKKYGPVYAIVGTGRLPQGLDEHLLKAEVGKENEVELLPEKAYGEYDRKKVQVYAPNKLARLKIEPVPGKAIVVDNKEGYVEAVFAGRVRVNFNHKLAGKTLKYKYKVISVAKTTEEKAKAVLAMDYGRQEEFQLAFEGEDAVTITLPDVCKYDPNWTLAKLRVVSDLREFAAMRTVTMREVYVKKEAGKEGEEVAAEAPHDEHEGHAHEHAELEPVAEAVPSKPEEPSNE